VRAFGQTCSRAIRTRFPQDAKQENVQLKDENAMLRRLVGGPQYRDSKTAGDCSLSASGQRRAALMTTATPFLPSRLDARRPTAAVTGREETAGAAEDQRRKAPKSQVAQPRQNHQVFAHRYSRRVAEG
jgi:hypothetical protein